MHPLRVKEVAPEVKKATENVMGMGMEIMKGLWIAALACWRANTTKSAVKIVTRITAEALEISCN